MAELVKRQQSPVIEGGSAVWSFVHVEDAAIATMAALDAEPGVYNVVDNDPEPVVRWLPAFARWVGAPEPACISAEDAYKQAGAEGIYAHTRLTGASHRKAKAILSFNPRPLPWMMQAWMMQEGGRVV